MNKEDNNKKNSTVKEYYTIFKEAWKDPRKKAGIKLLLWLLFFVILFSMAGITSRTNRLTSSTKEEINEDKYTIKQENLLNNKFNIKYSITINDNNYSVEGTIENGVVNGYIEYNESIKKISISDGTIYEIKNEEKNILDTEIDSSLLDLKSIIEKVKQNKSLISDKDSLKVYSYLIKQDEEDINIIITTNEDSITNINITKNNDKYDLNFSK